MTPSRERACATPSRSNSEPSAAARKPGSSWGEHTRLSGDTISAWGRTDADCATRFGCWYAARHAAWAASSNRLADGLAAQPSVRTSAPGQCSGQAPAKMSANVMASMPLSIRSVSR